MQYTIRNSNHYASTGAIILITITFLISCDKSNPCRDKASSFYPYVSFSFTTYNLNENNNCIVFYNKPESSISNYAEDTTFCTILGGNDSIVSIDFYGNYTGPRNAENLESSIVMLFGNDIWVCMPDTMNITFYGNTCDTVSGVFEGSFTGYGHRNYKKEIHGQGRFTSVVQSR